MLHISSYRLYDLLCYLDIHFSGKWLRAPVHLGILQMFKHMFQPLKVFKKFTLSCEAFPLSSYSKKNPPAGWTQTSVSRDFNYSITNVTNYCFQQSCFNFQRTIRLLLDTRGASNTFGLGIDREMALAIYRVGSEHEYAEVQKQKQIWFLLRSFLFFQFQLWYIYLRRKYYYKFPSLS